MSMSAIIRSLFILFDEIIVLGLGI